MAVNQLIILRGGVRYFNRCFEKFINVIQKPFIYASIFLRGIHIGRGCKFYGMPYWDINRGGSISIGDGCVFRSRKYSNHMGLNHRCMISATISKKGQKANVVIGNKCGFSGVSIWCFNEIILGNNVRVGANSLIMDGDAHDDDPRTTPPRPIHIEDNVFIGANCVIKKGVTIGKNSVIGMNSVVTHDIPANSIAVGVPAKVIRIIQTDKS